MTIQEIQRLREEKPFRTFRVLTTDGRGYDVMHPECLGPIAVRASYHDRLAG